jgi:hypothetical protein
MTHRKGVSPVWVLALGTSGLFAFAFAYTHSRESGAEVGNAFCVVAYVMALLSCWRAAEQYPEHSPIRLGWLAMGANCLLSIFRHLALNPVFYSWTGGEGQSRFLSQMIQLPALICAMAGILLMWWGVYRLELGFRLRWIDSAAIAATAGIVVWAFRNHLDLSHAGHGFIAVLQQISLGLLITIGGVGLLLHGLTLQMGGGRLAVVMRSVAVYALARSTLTLTQQHRQSFLLAWWLCFYAVPWIFAFGAAYSCWLADSVRRSIREQPLPDWDVSKLAS